MPIPENDFIDDLVDILEENGNQYILIVLDHGAVQGRVACNIKNWRTASPNKTPRQEIMQIVDTVVTNEEGR